MLRLALVALLLLGGCRQKRDLSQYTQEDPKSGLVSSLNVGDAKLAGQLRGGFHQVEAGGWRWTAGKFAVELRPPFASQTRGAILRLTGNLPEVLFAKTGPIEISAKLNGKALGSQAYRTAGEVAFATDVPAALMGAEEIVVEFATNKPLEPNTFPNDGRELGLIVSNITLETKK